MDISKWAFRNRNLIYFLVAVLLLGGVDCACGHTSRESHIHSQ